MKPYYSHDEIEIYHGNCCELLASMPRPDLVLTDPPYELVATGGGIGAKRDYLSKTAGFTDCGFDVEMLRGFANWMAFCSKAQLPKLLDVARASDRWALLTWNKPNPTPLVNGNYLPDTEYIVHHFESAKNLHGSYENRSRFMVHPSEPTSKVGHPNAKPLPVMHWLMQVGSGIGQLVVDPFMGSGTTLVAAKNLGRRAIGIEIEERYCELAARRLGQQVFQFEDTGS